MQLHLTFGLQLDQADFPFYKQALAAGHFYQGPKGLLHLLESYFGLSGHPSDLEYLRIENYRQALAQYLEEQPDSFYGRSFEADQFATAQELLLRRDELLQCGWEFSEDKEQPSRLQTLGAIEKRFDKSYPGFADRFDAVIRQVGQKKHPIAEIQLCEPEEILPQPVRRLLKTLAESGTTISSYTSPALSENAETDLEAFQRILAGSTTDHSLKADGSIVLLKGDNPNELSTFIAQLTAANPDYQPLFLIPEKNRNIDNAFVQEGLPAMGLESASLARPALQILKLAPAFLWDPIDPFKVLEFVSLALKPIDDDLANAIAGQLAQTPGLDGDGWRRTIAQAFDQLESKYSDNQKYLAGTRNQYQFWFNRKRYPLESKVPKKEVIELFAFIQNWAIEAFDQEQRAYDSLIVLTEQAKRIREILEALPEQQLSHLEVERIVRTIYQPAPIVFQKEQASRLDYTYHPGAIHTDRDQIIWWNFIQNEPVHFFSRWYQSERRFLEQHSIFPETPESQNQRRIWLRKRPVLHCKKQLLLVIPETVASENSIPHPLLGEMEAAFGDLHVISWQCGNPYPFADHQLKSPEPVVLEKIGFEPTQAFVTIDRPDWINDRQKESFTSLESLFYYPYQWVFRYQLKLRKSAILSVVADETLMGNLAHRLFEMLFEDPKDHWEKESLDAWIENTFPELLEKEGVVLLLYGREPQRISFLNRLKFAAWSLVSAIQNNGWKVEASEKELNGHFAKGLDGETEMRGFADLVLVRGDEKAIVDLKWRGLRRRSNMIRNEEDLQLILYSMLESGDPAKVHTAYFIIRDGQMVARDQSAFNEVDPVSADIDRQTVNLGILNRMTATYQWRLHQLKAGRIEIRKTDTVDQLEEIYFDEAIQWDDLLEMKHENAAYDDYQTLIGS